MAGKNWQAGSKNSIPATAVLCLVAGACPLVAAHAAAGDFAPASYVGSFDPNLIWEVLIGGIVVASFLGAIAIWVVAALRRAKRSQLRRNAFISTALNHLNQGVVMTDPRGRVIFCNDRYLEIYGLARPDLPRDMTGRELLALRRERGSFGEDPRTLAGQESQSFQVQAHARAQARNAPPTGTTLRNTGSLLSALKHGQSARCAV